MNLSRDFYDLAMHIWNGRYRVNLGGYGSGRFETYRFKADAMACYEKHKDSCPFASVEDWWFTDESGQATVLARCDNSKRFPAPPIKLYPPRRTPGSTMSTGWSTIPPKGGAVQ